MPKESDNNSTPLDLLRWMTDTFGEDIAPFEASTDLGLQITTYKCWDCNGEFKSRWPRWEKPTLETFPHEPNCRYVAAMRLTQP